METTMNRYWPYVESNEGGYRGVVLDRESKPVGYRVVRTCDTVRKGYGFHEDARLAEADARTLCREMNAELEAART